MGKKLLMNNGALMPVMDGLVCWLDGRDGKNGDTVWKDRSGNGNDFELVGNTIFEDLCYYTKSYNEYATNKNSDIIRYKELLTIIITFKNILDFNTKTSIGFCTSNNPQTTNGFKMVSRKETNSVEFYYSTETITPYQIPYSLLTNDIDTLAVTLNNKNLKEYYNGTFWNNQTVFTNISEGSISVGANPLVGSYRFDGKYASIMIYNRALTDSEIKQNYEYEKSIQRGDSK